MTTAFPLSWPDGWPRTAPQARACGHLFKQEVTKYSSDGTQSWQVRTPVTPDIARKKLFDELERMDAKAVVLSTNIPLRLDGMPRADAARARMDEPGVAVYFKLKSRQIAMACDRFDSVAANMRSLGLAIEAMRQLERHGGGTMMDRAFDGFAALPPPEGHKPARPWWEVLGYPPTPEERDLLSKEEVDARYRNLAKKRHPDAGGTDELMAELSNARDQAVAELTA